jgi:hypothetical protein
MLSVVVVNVVAPKFSDLIIFFSSFNCFDALAEASSACFFGATKKLENLHGK